MISKQPTSFLVSRAVLAIVLMIGFYLLALSIAGFLAWIPYAEIHYGGRIHIKLALICVIGSLAILWAIIPRPDRFEPPGPKLEESEHPKLFAELRNIARKTDQDMPAEVYLCPEVNAWVMQRGGIMGFGSRRVMGIGLPLLQVFTVPEFSAVLAHEFGHYYGGDTKLGPWIYKTRGMIGRTLNNLGESILQFPFLWYGKMFLRITHAISRRQEFLADELAARTVSPQAMISGLKMLPGATMGFQTYLHTEFAPVFGSQMRTPFVEGFQKFLSAPRINEAIAERLQKELTEGKSDPYDTHPALKERIAALSELPSQSHEENTALAITLLENAVQYELELLRTLTGNENVKEFKTISWNEVGPQVYLPFWKKTVEKYGAILRGKKVEDIFGLLKNTEVFGKEIALVGNSVDALTSDEKKSACVNVLGSALAFTLAQKGWKIEPEIGGEIRCDGVGASLEPFKMVTQVVEGKMAREEWDKITLPVKDLELAVEAKA